MSGESRTGVDASELAALKALLLTTARSFPAKERKARNPVEVYFKVKSKPVGKVAKTRGIAARTFLEFMLASLWHNRVYRLGRDRTASTPGFSVRVWFLQGTLQLQDPTLGQIDLLVDDPELVAICSRALAGRRQRSMDFGRSTIAPDRLLRSVVLKHLKGWSFRGLEEELRANLLYRRFTRFYEDPIPDHTVFSRLFALLGTEGP